MKKIGVVFIQFMFLLLLIHKPVSAGTILDQEYWNPTGGKTISGVGEKMSQTFTTGDYMATIGQDTAFLDHVEFYSYVHSLGGPIVDFEFWEVSSEMSSAITFGDMLGSVRGVDLSDSGVRSIDFSEQNIELQSETMYAIVAISTGTHFGWNVDWLTSFGEIGYTEGQLWALQESTGWVWTNNIPFLGDSFAAADAAFRTYVRTNPIPEPATAVLFGMGLLGVVGMSRKKIIEIQ